MRYFLLILTLLSSTGCANLIRPNFTPELATLRAGEYQLDPMHSYLLFKIEHLGLSKIVGRFNNVDATLDFNPKQIENMQLSAIVSADSIDVNNPDLESTLQEPDWFDTARFPQITFNSSSVNLTTTEDIEITGTLTLRGISKAITLNAKFNGGADNLITRKYTIGFSATTTIHRSDFGIDAFSALVGDTVELEAHGEFLRQ